MKSFTVEEILRRVHSVQGRVANSSFLTGGLGSIQIKRLSPLANSGPSDLALFFSREYESELASANPGVLLTAEPFVKPLEASGLSLWKSAAVIACKDPYLAFALLTEMFAPYASSVAHLSGGRNSQASREPSEIHPTAIVSASAKIGAGVKIGPYCIIEDDAQIGDGTVLYPHCYVGPHVVVGEDCVLFPKVSLYEMTVLGNRVRIHSSAVVGSDGFGYAPKVEAGRVVGHQKIYHLGRVVVGDDVEIGACSTIDRGTLGETRIDRNAKLDNQVHVGHNSRLEEGAILCGGVCLAGNARIGKYAYIGGLTGVVNHVHIGDAGKVGALSLVTKDVPPGGTAVGNPQREHKHHFQAHAHLSKLAKQERKGKKEWKTPID